MAKHRASMLYVKDSHFKPRIVKNQKTNEKFNEK